MKASGKVGLGALALVFGLLTNSTPAQTPARERDDDNAKVGIPGPIDNLSDLQDSGRMIFKLADANNDGQISQKEAVDAANLVLGGFFFRADANGDGVLSQQEAAQARTAYMNQNPILRAIAAHAKPKTAAPAANGQPTAAPMTDPLEALCMLFDANADKQIQAAELRQGVQTTVQGFYATADTNRDGQLSPTEVNAAMIGLVNAASQAAFQLADTDNNGQLSQDEFDKALAEPAHVIFRTLDGNGDGQLSPQEAESAKRLIMSQISQLNVPEPANSANNLIRSGAKPEQVAPVPSFGTPAAQPTRAPQPAPAPTTAPAPAPAQAPANPPQR